MATYYSTNVRLLHEKSNLKYQITHQDKIKAFAAFLSANDALGMSVRAQKAYFDLSINEHTRIYFLLEKDKGQACKGLKNIEQRIGLEREGIFDLEKNQNYLKDFRKNVCLLGAYFDEREKINDFIQKADVLENHYMIAMESMVRIGERAVRMTDDMIQICTNTKDGKHSIEKLSAIVKEYENVQNSREVQDSSAEYEKVMKDLIVDLYQNLFVID